jgi:oxygen-independent coproporphyrinogen III oxidase
VAGLYFHIPFCKKACVYCDFHFSTSQRQQKQLLDAMHAELQRHAVDLEDAPITSIYFGGGTPSMIEHEEIGTLLKHARDLLTVSQNAEITLEANPDDVTEKGLAQWQRAGVNRVSLGVQSFREDRLRAMGRAHTGAQAHQALHHIAQAGLASWTMDLIYGLPQMDAGEWQEQVRIALDRSVPHLSAYCLTVEPRTALHHAVAKGKLQMPDDTAQAEQFELLVHHCTNAGLEHYEISNFGKPGHHSRHNTAYWKGEPYLGIGPSAHSYNGHVRSWNVAHNARYIIHVQAGSGYRTEEVLTDVDRTNEALLTGLRTQWGVDLSQLPLDVRLQRASELQRWSASGHLQQEGHQLVLTRGGRLFADRIAADLFLSKSDRTDPA